MNIYRTFYIALGSNKGNKFQNLQNAIDGIHLLIGNIKIISKVYQSPAFGFDGEDFFNCCLVLETSMEPVEVMKTLLAIEKDLGRTRSNSKAYEARSIDLDILLVDDLIIDSEFLKVPHPEMHKRRFVLQPLNDLVPKMEHPIFKKTIAALFEECDDNTMLHHINIWLKNPGRQYDFSAYNYIAIEGNIGVGKTSLASKIAKDFNAKLVLERFADNPFLPKFYKDSNRYAFPLEMSFLADRYRQISDDLAQLDLFKDFVVSDYYVVKSLIFSKITLNADEFNLYRKLFHIMYKDIQKPDLYVYLYQNTENLQQNIMKRGREYEQNIGDDYLTKINSGYIEFLKTQTDLNVKIIDVTNKNFVENRADYLWVLGQITNQSG